MHTNSHWGKNMIKIGFIGSGRIAEAMMRAMINTKVVEAHGIFASDPSVERRNHLKREYGINVYSHNGDVVAAVDILFIAIKPQQIAEALAPLAEAVTADQLVISIAAGRTIASIEALLPAARVVRIMPNLPCQVAEGMTAFCLGHKTRTGDQRIVGELLACFGRVLEMPESKFDVVTAISGSGPAFFAHFLCRIVEAGVANGLTNDEATLLAEQTMLGTARVLLTGETHPHDFIRAVTSPQGTTEAGLTALASPVLADLVNKTIQRATERSRELSA